MMMRSVLEQIGMKSPASAAKKTTRQVTLENAFSRVGNRKASDTFTQPSSTPPSMTTGTSNTDNSSEVNEDTARPEDIQGDLERAKVGIHSDMDSSPSGTSLSSQKDVRLWRNSRDVSGATTLVNGKSDFSEDLLHDDVEGHNEEWSNGTMHSKNLRRSTPSTTEEPKTQGFRPRVQRPARRVTINQALKEVGNQTKSLGKRARETVESGKDEVTALYGETKTRLRQKGSMPPPPPTEGRAAKKTRLSESVKKEVSPEPMAPKKKMPKPTKTWLEKGLYVGQDRDFDPRLTEARNKKKLGHKTGERKPVMPLPMYSGQKALENGRNFRLPFSVFSPLPSGQPKPDEWKKTQKNVFIGEAATEWKKGKKLEDSVCDCVAEDGCDEQCYNRSMLYECDEKNCKLSKEDCTNRSFAELKERLKAGGKYNVGVEVLKTTDRGYGIRANRCFDPGQIIVEYTGEIITKEECDSRMRGVYKDAGSYYLMDFDQSMILDATRGSIARFVNHSCSPNCRMAKWTVQGVPRMALFAGDNEIMTGEELTYDYNFNPFSMKNVQVCRCGSDNCRGFLGPKPKEAKEKELREALEPIASGGKRKFQQIAEDAIEGVKSVTKKRKLEMPSTSDIKAAMMRAQMGIKSSILPPSKEKQPASKKMKIVEPAKEQKKVKEQKAVKEPAKEKSKKGSKPKPKLPIGWVYTEELEEPPPPVVRNIFATDPEALIRSENRKRKQESEEAGSASKKRRTTSGETLIGGDSENRSSKKMHAEFEMELEDAEAEGHGGRPASGRGFMKARAKIVRKNIVRTIKGRNGQTPGASGGKSIKVVADERDEADEEIE